MRKIFENIQIGKITQGSIISGCIAEDFPDMETFGCIITPRCDLEHNGKVRTVHYLPIVPFEQWYMRIAIYDIFEQWKAELRGTIDHDMYSLGTGERITSLELDKNDLLKLLKSKSQKKKQLEQVEDKIEKFYSAIEGKYFKQYLSSNKGKHIDYLKQLKENKIASCYLLERWSDKLPSRYYVMMLRDVRRLSLETAKQIAGGIIESDMNRINLQVDDLYVSPEKEEIISYVTGQISSPFIEHIIQALMHNFNRIGVEDMPIDAYDDLITIANNIKK